MTAPQLPPVAALAERSEHLVDPPAPAILCLTAENADVLRAQFSRYAAEYALHIETSPQSVVDCLEALEAAGAPIALFVLDTSIGFEELGSALPMFRRLVPTAKRLAVTPWGLFMEHLETFRHKVAKGAFDAHLLMPRGIRDEEFHSAVVELLNDWGSTVAAPLVETVRIVAPTEDAAVRRLRDFLFRTGSPHRFYTPDSPIGQEVIASYEGETGLFPLVRLADLPAQHCPDARTLARAVYGRPDLQALADVTEVLDVIVVGAGPAGLAGCVYAASEGLSTLALEAEVIGGQAGTSSMIRNYLGFPRGISGMRLTTRARTQAVRFGTRFFTGWPVEELVPGAGGAPHQVRTEAGTLLARTVVIATGVAYRRLGVDALEALVGHGVHYGAAMSSAPEVEGRDVIVVGGGNSAGQAAIHLARFASSVTLVVRREDLRASMSAYLITELEANPRITVRGRTRVVDGGASEGELEWVDLEDIATGERERRRVGGLYLLLGAEPHCDWLPDAVCRDDRGFVLTGRDVPPEHWSGEVPPADLETAVPGVYCAGDVRSGSMKRVASATGEGAAVVSLVHEHLAAL